MDLVWIVPLAVLVAGLIPVLAVAGRVARELGDLRADLARWSQMRPAVVEVRDEAAELRRLAAALRTRR